MADPCSLLQVLAMLNKLDGKSHAGKDAVRRLVVVQEGCGGS